MGIYQVYKLDDPMDETSNGTFVCMVTVDSILSIIGATGTGEGVDETGVLHHWAPPEGCVAVLHPEGENQPEVGARREA